LTKMIITFAILDLFEDLHSMNQPTLSIFEIPYTTPFEKLTSHTPISKLKNVPHTSSNRINSLLVHAFMKG
jgi:hypothetical protein